MSEDPKLSPEATAMLVRIANGEGPPLTDGPLAPELVELLEAGMIEDPRTPPKERQN